MENLELNYSQRKNDNSVIPENKNASGKEHEFESEILNNIPKEDIDSFLVLQEELANGIEDLEDAREAIKELREVTDPIVSVPRKFYNEIKKTGSLTPHETWIPGTKVLAGTLGVSPYSPEGEERIYFKVKSHVSVEPRFTQINRGPRGFHGIVSIPENRLELGNDIEEVQFH